MRILRMIDFVSGISKSKFYFASSFLYKNTKTKPNNENRETPYKEMQGFKLSGLPDLVDPLPDLCLEAIFTCFFFLLPLSGKHWHLTARKTISRLELVEFICFLRVLQSPPHNPKACILVSVVFSLTFLLLRRHRR